jgi:hypothetical protein
MLDKREKGNGKAKKRLEWCGNSQEGQGIATRSGNR